MAAKGNFVFVNVCNPAEPEGESSRRTVRSRAAAYSHRVAPRRGAKAARYNTGFEQEDASRSNSISAASAASAASPIASRKSSSSPDHPNDLEGGEDARARKHARVLSPAPRVRKQSPIIKIDPELDSSHIFIHEQPHRDYTIGKNAARSSRKNSSEKSVVVKTEKRVATSFITDLPVRTSSPTPIVAHTVLDRGRSDPFSTYPVQHHAWFDWLFDFWYGCVLPKGTKLVKASDQTMQNYSTWSKRMEVSEPCLYYIGLFLATGIPVSQGKIPLDTAIWLRGQAVKSLQEALEDPKRALTNAVILAVGRVALHEHIYGDKELCHNIHRPAQRRMIAIRGGIQAMDLPLHCLHMMVWSDALMAVESGTPSNFVAYQGYLAERGIYVWKPEEAIYATATASPQRHKHPGYGFHKTPSPEYPPNIEGGDKSLSGPSRPPGPPSPRVKELSKSTSPE